MNKLLQKVAKLFLGISMAAGVGVAIGAGRKIANEVRADSYTITFSGSNSESTSISTSTTAASITGSSTYVTGNVAAATKAYGATSDGIKLGTSSAAGSIKINLSSTGQVTPSSIVVYAKLYNSSKSATLGVNGSTKQSVSSSYGNITFNITTAITYIQIDVTKYVWVKSITVNYTSVTDYNFTKSGTHCTIGGPSKGNINANATFPITPDSGYNAPTSVTVQRGSSTLSPGTNVYSYSVSNNVGTLVIDKSQITAAISISATANAIVPTGMTLSSTVSTLTVSSGNYVVNLATGDTTQGAPENCYDEDLTATLTPSTALDKSVTWSCTDASELIDQEVWFDDDNELMFRFSTASEGSFTITATSNSGSVVKTVTYNIAQKYSISTNVTNGSKSAGDTEIFKNGSASVTISASSGYKVPANDNYLNYITVTNASFTYNNGVISLSSPTGNVTVSVTCPQLSTFTITVNETNGTHTGSTTIQENGNASLTFTPSIGYGQPATVTVSGATSSWAKGSGILSLSNPTDNVTVTYEAVGNALDSITLSVTTRDYTLGDDFVKPTVTAHYTVAADADVTSSTTYSGYDPYTTGNQTVTFTYTESGVTKTTTYTAKVSAASVTTTTTWELTDLADLTSSDEFVIARTSSPTVALPSNGGAARPTVSSVTISNDKITSTVTDSILWNVTGNASDGYVFNPKGDSSNWLYLLADNNDGVRIGNGNNATNKHFTLEQGYLYSTETTYPRMVGVYNDADWRCYKLTSGGEPGANIAGQTFGFFKKVVTQTGQADLIRITASYSGDPKFVGDSISTSDFTVKKQLNTGNELIDVASGFTISANTLTEESNSITVSLTEGNITKTAVVVVPATPRSATVTSVTLVQGVGVVKDYIDYSAAAWDYTGLTVHCVWSDSTFNEDLSVADLIQSGDATVSPAKPAVGVTSFTISYQYHEVPMTSNSVTGINVVADYVTGISWTGTTGSHFKSFSGGQLTAAQVGTWSVVPTLAGAGQQSALSFGSYTLKVGNKTISSLPYTWASEDDGQKLTITYGKDENGDDFVKENGTAVANICATINAIDHDEESSGAQSIDLDVANATFDPEGTPNTGSEASATINGFTITTDKGYFDAGTSLRVYSGAEFTISSSYTINSVSYTFTGGKTGLAGGTELETTEFTETSSAQARVVSIHIEYQGTVTTTTHYANQAEHFDAQKAVVTFAKFMNTTMNGSNVCSGTFANLESAWDDVAYKYDELFGSGTSLNATELSWGKNMLKYASAVWGSDTEAACVEKAMKTYDFCVSKYSLTPFLDQGRAPGAPQISPLVNIIGKNTNTVAIIVIISMVSVTAIGGYFFLRKRKENI